MASIPHRIRRLRVRVQAASQAEAFALRSRLRAVVDEALLPPLARAFDEIAPGDDVVHVARLELHATVRSLDELAGVLPELVRRELAGRAEVTGRGGGGEAPSRDEAASEAVASGGAAGVSSGPARLDGPGRGGAGEEVSRTYPDATRPARGAGPARGDAAAPSGPGDAEPAGAAEGAGTPAPEGVAMSLSATADDGGGDAATSAPPARGVTRASMQDERLRVLTCYLETGALPWHIAGEEAIETYLAHPSPDEIARAVAAGVANAELQPLADRMFRLLQLVPEQQWAATARAITRSPAELVDLLAGAVAALAGDVALSRYARLRAAAVVIAALRAGPARAREGEIARHLTPLLGIDPTAASAGVERLPAPLVQLLRRLEGDTPERTAVVPRSPAPGADPNATSRAVDGPLFDRTAAPPVRLASGARRPADEPLGTPVRWAGLILLHPFLPRFFENTGIRRAGSSLEEAALPRAAALLHACATGEDEPFEYDIGFLKILLGLALDAPLPVAGGLLGDADRDEVEGLLRAVGEHWSPLKRTSAQGLRATFLQRGGLVREEARGFRLQVEPASFDVLLAQLPWGIGVVKLPWMAKGIFTEWPTP